MAFVYENVPEADWELYNSFNLKSYDGKRQLIANVRKTWTIDRERNIYFILLGGGAFEQPRKYALIWYGKKITVCVNSRVVIDDDSSNQIHWDICHISAPKSLELKKDELISVIKEIVYFELNNYKFVIDNITDLIFVELGRLIRNTNSENIII